MHKRLRAVGNSLAIIIPKRVLEVINWDRNTELSITAYGSRLIIEPKAEDPPPKLDLFAQK